MFGVMDINKTFFVPHFKLLVHLMTGAKEFLFQTG